MASPIHSHLSGADGVVRQAPMFRVVTKMVMGEPKALVSPAHIAGFILYTATASSEYSRTANLPRNCLKAYG